MNVLELKGELIELIANVQSESLLLRLKESILKFREEKLDFTLTSEQELELLGAIEESYDEKNLIDISEAKKLHAQWLQ